MVYLNAFGDMALGARGCHCGRLPMAITGGMRATPESTQQTGLGGPDERVVRTRNDPADVDAEDIAPLPSSVYLSRHIAIERR